MRITKARLKEIIKEEVQNFKEARGYGNETEVGDDVVGRANQDFETDPTSTKELVNSWAGEVEKWIATQWSADSDFNSVRAERPAIAAALRQVADKMENEPEPEPHFEGKKK